jgi:thioredoxin reductase (NADPH)
VADGFEVIVAGGGIAGMTAALHSARAGRSTLALAGNAPGGLLLSIEKIEGVPGFPEGVPGYDLCPMLQEQAEEAGADVRMQEVTALEPADDGWRLTADDEALHAKVVIFATGARLRHLGVPGEERLQGRGVSHCASCDAPLLRDKAVGVVGGGDSALQEALTLAEQASEVIVLHRGEHLDAHATYRRRAEEHPNITLRYQTVVEEILGDENVGGVRIRDLSSDATDELELAGVFVYVGLDPNTELLPDRLELDEERRIATDQTNRTDQPGLLAAGYVRRGALGQAAISAGDGANAAKSAHRYLQTGEWAHDALAATGGPHA